MVKDYFTSCNEIYDNFKASTSTLCVASNTQLQKLLHVITNCPHFHRDHA